MDCRQKYAIQCKLCPAGTLAGERQGLRFDSTECQMQRALYSQCLAWNCFAKQLTNKEEISSAMRRRSGGPVLERYLWKIPVEKCGRKIFWVLPYVANATWGPQKDSRWTTKKAPAFQATLISLGLNNHMAHYRDSAKSRDARSKHAQHMAGGERCLALLSPCLSPRRA
jgi:hypothetical protein